ncbi:hypothetical protein MTO96_015548 [Rhipicephalus appendiculatus]
MERGVPRPPAHLTAPPLYALASRESGARKVEEREQKKERKGTEREARAGAAADNGSGGPSRAGQAAGKCPARTGRPNRWPTLAQLTNGAAHQCRRRRHDSPLPDAVATLCHARLRSGTPMFTDAAIVTEN